VLAGGVAIWLGDLVLPCVYRSLELGRIESENRLLWPDGVTGSCPFGSADPSMNG
jgi:hypothetical protein